MKNIQKVIYAGFAAVALVSASLPVFSVAAPLFGVYGPDYPWYGSLGRPAVITDNYEVMPPPRAGHIWSPGRWEWNGYRHQWVAGHWIKDDYAEQLAMYNTGSRLVLVPVVRDANGNVVAYDVAPPPPGTLRR